MFGLPLGKLENENLKSQLDEMAKPETKGLDASGYDDFDRYIAEKGISERR